MNPADRALIERLTDVNADHEMGPWEESFCVSMERLLDDPWSADLSPKQRAKAREIIERYE